MPQSRDEPLEKVTLNLFVSDMEWLRREVGEGRVADTIRRVLRQWRTKQEALSNEW